MIKFIVNRKLKQLKNIFNVIPGNEAMDHVYYTESKEFCIQVNTNTITEKQLKSIDGIELRIISITWNKDQNILELTLKPKPWFLAVFTALTLVSFVVFLLL